MEIPVELIERMTNHEVVFFVGAGLSIGAGLPDWNQLLLPLADRLNLPENRRVDLLQIAQDYENAEFRHALIRYLREKTDTTGKEPTANHRRLARLGIQTWITTNFDDLLELTLRKSGQRCEKVVQDSDLPYTHENALTLIKLHGDREQPDSIVITKKDYANYITKFPGVRDKLATLMRERTFLFVGYSIRDPDFNGLRSRIAEELKQHQRPAYAVLPKADEFEVRDLRDRNILVLNLNADDIGDPSERLGEFLDDLLRRIGRGGLEEAEAQPTEQTSSNAITKSDDICLRVTSFSIAPFLPYLETLQRELHVSWELHPSLGVQTKENSISVLVQRWSGQRNKAEPICSAEQAATENQHLIFIGEGGSGKTTTLRRLVFQEAQRALASGDEAKVPVLVDLNAYTSHYQGNLLDLIAAKLSMVGIDRTALGQYLIEGRFVLAFDGFNEVAENRKSDVVRELRQFLDCTSANRNNRVMITTRSRGYHDELGLPIFEIQQLDHVGLVETVKRYFTEDEAQGQRFLEQLGADRDWAWNDPGSMISLARNPLHLSFLMLAFREHGSLPPNRGQLFREFLEWKLEHWEEQHGKAGQFDYQDKFPLLAALAFEMMKGEGGTRTNWQLAEDLFVRLRDDSGRSILREVVRNGILRQVDRDIEWMHQLVQEYFAAEHLLRLKENGHLPTREMAMDPVKWETVLQMAAGLHLDYPEYQSFLAELLKGDLTLFMSCIDIGPAAESTSPAVFALFPEQYFVPFLHTYTSIIDQYFMPIRCLFDPFRWYPGADKAAVVGDINRDGTCIYALVGREANASFLEPWPGGRSLFEQMERARGALDYTMYSGELEPDPSRGAAEHIRTQICGWRSILATHKLLLPLDLLHEVTRQRARAVNEWYGHQTAATYAEIAELCEKQMASHGSKTTIDLMSRLPVRINRNFVEALRLLHEFGFRPDDSLLPEPDNRPPGVLALRIPQRTWYRSADLIQRYVTRFFELFLKNYREIIDLNFPALAQHFRMYPSTDVVVHIVITDEPLDNNLNRYGEAITYSFLRGSGNVRVYLGVLNVADARIGQSGAHFVDSLLRHPGSLGRVTETVLDKMFSGRDIEVPLTDFVYECICDDMAHILKTHC